MAEHGPGELKKVIYGPVPSWRLGRSLGIDLISGPKTCSFDCIYCQLGPTRHKCTQRAEFVATERVVRELESLPEVEADFVTFSGTGEPTLASNLGEAIAEAGDRFQSPVAVLTNSSLIADPEVRSELALADLVVAKLDASDEESFREVNRPANGIRFQSVLTGLRQFRDDYAGRLAVQVMFCKQNRDRAGEIAAAIRDLRPDEVQLNTPLRPSPTPPLSPQQMREIGQAFVGLPTVSVYEASEVTVDTLDAAETAARRPHASGRPEGSL